MEWDTRWDFSSNLRGDSSGSLEQHPTEDGLGIWPPLWPQRRPFGAAPTLNDGCSERSELVNELLLFGLAFFVVVTKCFVEKKLIEHGWTTISVVWASIIIIIAIHPLIKWNCTPMYLWTKPSIGLSAEHLMSTGMPSGCPVWESAVERCPWWRSYIIYIVHLQISTIYKEWSWCSTSLLTQA